MIFFFVPFFQLIYNDDKELANALCSKNKTAIGEFLELYSDELYFISSKFNNRGIPQDAWEYRTKTGYTIQVTDDVSDSFLWLTKQAVNKSCAFRGGKGATFETYIKAVLNSDFTFKDWLKWKTGVTGYVPKCIKHLGSKHSEVFTLLRQKKDNQDICNRLTLENQEYLTYYIEIENALIAANQIDLIHDPKFVYLNDDAKDDENNTPIQLESKEFSDPSEQPLVDSIREMMQKIVGLLDTAERRLIRLYWGESLSADKIIEIFSDNKFKSLGSSLILKKAGDVYTCIEHVIDKSMGLLEEHYYNIFTEYSIDKKRMKKLFKTCFIYFE